MTRTLWMLALALAAALGFTSPALAGESYQYDAMGRLTDVAYANGGSLHYSFDANGNIVSIVTSLATAVEENSAVSQFALGRTTPNPGGGLRLVSFTLPSRGRASLRVFDVNGRLVATLVDRTLDAGRQDVRFPSDSWSNGLYFYRLEWAGQTKTGRLVVLR